MDNRFDQGEPRYRVLGQIEGRLFLVVCTPVGGAFRMISGCEANAREVARSAHSSPYFCDVISMPCDGSINFTAVLSSVGMFTVPGSRPTPLEMEAT